MSRAARYDVDYFPHYIKRGKKMAYIEKKYENDGYATWFKLLEALGEANYHYLDIRDDVTMMFLSERCNVDEIKLKSIIDDLVKLGEFDKDFYNDDLLYNEKFVSSIADAYKKRINVLPNRDTVIAYIISIGRNTSLIPGRNEQIEVQTGSESDHKGSIIPKLSLKDRIGKDSKVEDTIISDTDPVKKTVYPQPNAVGNFKTPDDLKLFLTQPSEWQNVFCMNAGIKLDAFPYWLNKFHQHALSQAKECINRKEYIEHFNNWIKKQDKSESNFINSSAGSDDQQQGGQQLSAIARRNLAKKAAEQAQQQQPGQ